MEKRFWFKNKTYGWGWTPATWEGWLTIAVWLLGFLFLTSRYLVDRLDGSIPSNRMAWALGAWVAALLLVCWRKGETPEWRWGGKPLRDRNKQ